MSESAPCSFLCWGKDECGFGWSPEASCFCSSWAPGLSVFVPALRLRILDTRPRVSREALLLVAALCDALTSVPPASSPQSPLADNAAAREIASGLQLYEDLLVPAVLERLGDSDQKVHNCGTHASVTGRFLVEMRKPDCLSETVLTHPQSCTAGVMLVRARFAA